MSNAEISQVIDRLRDVDPDAIAARLRELETEMKALRVLLRASRSCRPRETAGQCTRHQEAKADGR